MKHILQKNKAGFKSCFFVYIIKEEYLNTPLKFRNAYLRHWWRFVRRRLGQLVRIVFVFILLLFLLALLFLLDVLDKPFIFVIRHAPYLRRLDMPLFCDEPVIFYRISYRPYCHDGIEMRFHLETVSAQ